MVDTLTPVLSAIWDVRRSWTLKTYEQHDGYQALRQALRTPRGDLVDAVKASGLRGRGGAGFPTGMKWGFLPPDDGLPRYLVVNADESEPGTCKDTPLMLANPHVLIEGVIISAYAIGAARAFIYLRGEELHVYRRLLKAVADARAAGYIGTDVLGSGYDIDVVVHAGAGRVHLRRGDRPAGLARGSPRPATPQAAVPGRGRAVRAAHGGQQRRVDRQRAVDRPQRRRMVRGHGHREVEGLRPVLGLRPRQAPRPVRGPAGHHHAPAPGPGRRHARGQHSQVLDPGRLVDAAVHRGAPRRPARLRVHRGSGVDAGHPSAADVRPDHLGRARGAALDGVLRPRVVRQVHPVP